MMQTLRKIYEDLISDTIRWSYYCGQPYLCCNTISNNEESYEFIKKYFACGGKETLFDDTYLNENSEIIKMRAPHIISTYLLGIIIAESFNLELNGSDYNSTNKYLWFLACLYHDIGYIYEEKHCCEYLRMLQANGLDAIQEICNIKYLHNYEFKTYSKENVNLYLSCRAQCSKGRLGKIDHGIAGGLLLYDRLRKNFEVAWRKARKSDPTISKSYFTYNGLCFSNKHYGDYAKAADAIISHNIWLNTLNRYLLQSNKMPQKGPAITKENPIAFILAIADTVEPIKKFGIYSLDAVEYEKSENNGFKFFVPDLYEDNYKYIMDLQDWVDVKVNRVGDGTFLITN